MTRTEQPTLPGVGLLPDLPGYVHGIKSVDPPRIQCDGCGRVDEGRKLALTILLSDIKFQPVLAGRGDRRRMCSPCWERAEHFTEALIVVTRAPRSARLWEMARKVGFALRADAQAAHDDATLRGLWDAYRFLVPTRLLEDYQDPEPATGPNVVRSVFPGGLPGLGRRC